MEIVLNYKDLDVNCIKFIDPLDNIIMKKGLHINMIYKSMDYTLNEIILETPIMEVPFGIKKYDESDNKNKNKFYLDLSFKGYNDENSEVKLFYEKIKELDDYIIDSSKKFSNKWQLSGNNQSLYVNQIRYNYKDNLNKFPPTFKIKMSKNKNGYFTNQLCFDKSSNNILENIINVGSKIQVVIKCNGIWSIKNRFGLTWKVRYIKVIQDVDKNLISNNVNDDCYLLCDFEEDEKYIDFDMEDYEIYMS